MWWESVTSTVSAGALGRRRSPTAAATAPRLSPRPVEVPRRSRAPSEGVDGDDVAARANEGSEGGGRGGGAVHSAKSPPSRAFRPPRDGGPREHLAFCIQKWPALHPTLDPYPSHAENDVRPVRRIYKKEGSRRPKTGFHKTNLVQSFTASEGCWQFTQQPAAAGGPDSVRTAPSVSPFDGHQSIRIPARHLVRRYSQQASSLR